MYRLIDITERARVLFKIRSRNETQVLKTARVNESLFKDSKRKTRATDASTRVGTLDKVARELDVPIEAFLNDEVVEMIRADPEGPLRYGISPFALSGTAPGKRVGVRDARAGTVSVPEYDLRLSAGGGSVNSDHESSVPSRFWGMPEEFLRSMRLSARNIRLVALEGDSMEPLLRDGDIVLIDERSRDPRTPAIYALWEGNGAVCKRVEVVKGSDPLRYRLISVNPEYSTFEVLASDADIIGRVAWFARRT